MASAYRSRFFLILIAVIVLPASSLLKGQSSRGAILGTVRDPAGALVPGAKVSVANQATNISFEYETDTTGNYYVPSLIPGRYRIAVEKAGGHYDRHSPPRSKRQLPQLQRERLTAGVPELSH